MTKDLYHLKHALHNEAVCLYLKLGQKFEDWIITTAFYSSLKFVSHKIFPFNVQAIEGKTTTIKTLEQYHSYSNPKSKTKHQVLAKLVEDTFSEKIANSYEWLLDSSMKSRYDVFEHDKAIADKAVRMMGEIKKECASAKEIAECT